MSKNKKICPKCDHGVVPNDTIKTCWCCECIKRPIKDCLNFDMCSSDREIDNERN